MTQEQIKDYEFCKRHLAQISTMEEKNPFNEQMNDCGYKRYAVSKLGLDKIHTEMQKSITDAIAIAKAKIFDKIEKL